MRQYLVTRQRCVRRESDETCHFFAVDPVRNSSGRGFDNTGDLVDRSAPYVVGGYLFDKPRDILYELARSKDLCERRTAIVATYYFIRQDDTAETFKIAEMLINDDQDLIHKAVGGWVREAGKRDPDGLLDFLDRFAGTMPRTALRYAVEHPDKTQRDYYMGLKKQA